MSYPLGEAFAAQIADAEQQAAYDTLHTDFASFYSTRIASLNAEVRVGALSLLAAAGTKIDGSLSDEYYLRNKLSTGFLLAGDIQSHGEKQEAPVIKIDAGLDTHNRRDRKLYNHLLDVSYARDLPGMPSKLAELCVNRMTTRLNETPITVSCGFISNLEPDDPNLGWNRFTQTRSRIIRPTKVQASGSNNITPGGYFKRRIMGDVLVGWHVREAIFETPEPDKLTVPAMSTLPAINLTHEESRAFQAGELTPEELFDNRYAAARHNTAIATNLFEEVKSRATTMASGKFGRWFWYGGTSWKHKLRLGPRQTDTQALNAGIFPPDARSS